MNDSEDKYSSGSREKVYSQGAAYVERKQEIKDVFKHNIGIKCCERILNEPSKKQLSRL